MDEIYKRRLRSEPTRPLAGSMALMLILATFLALAAAACGDSGSEESGSVDRDRTGSSTDLSTSSSSPCPSTGEGQRITVGGQPALCWGDGDHGVVLAHGASYDAASWSQQAPEMAATGATVVAVEDISEEGILAATRYLRDVRHVSDVAFIGGSAGADSMLSLLSEQPDLADQIILLSPNRVVDGLGDQPKLFIAGRDEPVAHVSTELAESSPGSDNEVKLLPGSTHAQGFFEIDQAPEVLKLILDRLG